MLSEKNETFFYFKNRGFQGAKNRFFSKGLTHALGQKMPIFCLLTFGQNKTRNNA